MKEKNYESRLDIFKKEVKSLKEQAFINVDQWYLCGEPLNGVEIGYLIADPCARKLLHYVGLKHELLPLCPNEVVDLDVKEGKILGSIVRVNFGKLRIKP